ncbi:hypothetical protein CEXT_147461 [Caerostris extrusa]|uniref:LAGLIDADG homing endonuclease n=1 Tax=Caerostris extrusa TaxID=172846 RepID=A0AAV4PZ68_CAEEX|nr:hypothetical protein CEXT_147461 [Caerostris extrusa]
MSQPRLEPEARGTKGHRAGQLPIWSPCRQKFAHCQLPRGRSNACLTLAFISQMKPSHARKKFVLLIAERDTLTLSLASLGECYWWNRLESLVNGEISESNRLRQFKSTKRLLILKTKDESKPKYKGYWKLRK